MNDHQRKLPSDEIGISPREIEKSIKRIEEELYYSSDNIKVRIGKIEEKLEQFATREDLEKLKTELIKHSNTTFRWAISIFVAGTGVLVALLKFT